MGQKVSPHGLRVGVIKDWDSKWYADKSKFADYLVEDNKVRDFVKKKLYVAGVSKIVLERAAENKLKVIVMTARPGMVIGRSGTGIEDLKSELEKITGKTIIIDIKEVRRTELDAQLMQKEAKEMADKISEESEAMKVRFIDFRTRYKKLLQSELQRFESLSGEMFPELGVDDFDDLPEMTPLQNLEQKPGAKAAPKPAPKPERGTYDYGKSNNGAEMQKTMRNIKY